MVFRFTLPATASATVGVKLSNGVEIGPEDRVLLSMDGVAHNDVTFTAPQRFFPTRWDTKNEKALSECS